VFGIFLFAGIRGISFRVLDEFSYNEERPGTFRILLDGGPAFALGGFKGAGMNEFGAFGEMRDRPLGVGGGDCTWGIDGREALHKNSVAASELHTVKEIAAGRETDAAGLDKVSDITGRVENSKTTQDFGAVERSGLSQETRGQERENESE